MAYNAVVCNVMIASPSDVEEERNIAREVIWRWNYLHSERTNIVLLPVAWETHSAPDMGGRPQAVINKQVLERCDLLIGIFWRRLGTPTGQEPSGTVEEIKEHRRKGKPVMLYFSSANVAPNTHDSEEFKRVTQFKDKCQREGLIGTYADVSEFRGKLERHLVKTVYDHDYFKKIVSALTDSAILKAGSDTSPEQQLSEEARDLLLEAVQDRNGSVLSVMTMGGLTIQANNKNMLTAPRDARCQAVWQGALDELVENGLLADVGYKGEVFRVTRYGYEVADLLKASA